MGVGTLREYVDGEQAHLVTFLAKSQALGSGSNHEADKQQCAYKELQLRTEEVPQERDQLQSNLLDLLQQVAFLMTKREREKTALELPTAEEEVKGDNAEVGLYMEVHGNSFYLDQERVFELGTWLWGEATNRLVGLIEEDVLEIYNLEWFLLALRQRFEDPLAEEHTRGELQRLQQGNRSISEFTTDFCRLASRLCGWPDLVLASSSRTLFTPRYYNGP
uniref:Uncharacterized protein n=1 Tax=Sphaerodactylus townsendi TaxID=933632 RepID=A0ACB8G4E7_9SAUR